MRFVDLKADVDLRLLDLWRSIAEGETLDDLEDEESEFMWKLIRQAYSQGYVDRELELREGHVEPLLTSIHKLQIRDREITPDGDGEDEEGGEGALVGIEPRPPRHPGGISRELVTA